MPLPAAALPAAPQGLAFSYTPVPKRVDLPPVAVPTVNLRWLAMLLLLAVACGRTPSVRPVAWQTTPHGLTYALVEARVGADQLAVPVHLLRFSPNRFETVVVRPTPTAQAGQVPALSDAAGFLQAAHAVAAINAGYFDPQYRPLGLLVSHGRQLSKLRQVDHGVFYVAGQRPGLVHARDWKPPPDLEFAVECGPRLLVDGKPLTFKPSGRARRVAIGHDAQGQVVLAVSEGVLGLDEWAELLARPEERGGAGLQAALNLDGGSSTMLEVASGPLRVSVRSAVRVPVGVAVVLRPTPASADTAVP